MNTTLYKSVFRYIALFVLLGLLVIAIPTSDKVFAWADANWTYRKVCSGNMTSISENLVSFGTLVEVSTANGFDLSQFKSGGVDFAAWDSDDSTRLPVEPEGDWVDGVGGHFWVGVPQWNATSSYSDYFYIYWGNVAATTASYNPTLVWDADYVYISHMNDLTTANITESTINNYVGTKGVVNKPLQSSGYIGYSQRFSASTNDTINMGAAANLNFTTQNFTIELWENFEGTEGQTRYILDRGAANLDGWAFIKTSATNNRFGFQTFQLGAVQTTSFDINTVGHNVWEYVAMTRIGSLAQLYINNVSGGSGNTHINPSGNITRPFQYGYGVSSNITWVGYLDEVRVSKTARSNEWLEATYLTETDNFLYYGATDPPPNVTTSAATNVYMLSGTHATLNGVVNDLGGAPTATAWFEWGYGTGYGNTVALTSYSAPGTLTYSLNHYAPDRTVHYRIVGQNVDGTTYGSDQSFSIATTPGAGGTELPVFNLTNAIMPMLLIAFTILGMITLMRAEGGINGIIFLAVLVFILLATLIGLQSSINNLW